MASNDGWQDVPLDHGSESDWVDSPEKPQSALDSGMDAYHGVNKKYGIDKLNTSEIAANALLPSSLANKALGPLKRAASYVLQGGATLDAARQGDHLHLPNADTASNMAQGGAAGLAAGGAMEVGGAALGGAKAAYRAFKPGTQEENLSKLKELLTGKTVEVDPSRYNGLTPEADSVMSRNVSEQAQGRMPPDSSSDVRYMHTAGGKAPSPSQKHAAYGSEPPAPTSPSSQSELPPSKADPRTYGMEAEPPVSPSLQAEFPPRKSDPAAYGMEPGAPTSPEAQPELPASRPDPKAYGMEPPTPEAPSSPSNQPELPGVDPKLAEYFKQVSGGQTPSKMRIPAEDADAMKRSLDQQIKWNSKDPAKLPANEELYGPAAALRESLHGTDPKVSKFYKNWESSMQAQSAMKGANKGLNQGDHNSLSKMLTVPVTEAAKGAGREMILPDDAKTRGASNLWLAIKGLMGGGDQK